jgi:hypothetical protein
MSKSKRPIFKSNRQDKPEQTNGLFAIIPIIPQIIIIAIVFGAFAYINHNSLFPLWISYIYYAAKIIIALEIIIAAAKSLTGPLLAIILGVLNLYFLQTQALGYISPGDSWQLIIVGIAGVIITFIVKSLKR